jgi:uncharacterized phiE125 gp8 family phage protein
MATWTRTIEPDQDLVDFQSLIDFSHLDDDAESNEPGLTDMLAAAVQHFEEMAGVSLMTQQWRLTLDAWPCSGVIRLPRGPLWVGGSPEATDVTIEYTDSAGDDQTLSTSLYLVDSDSVPPRITPAYGTTWPSLRNQTNAVRVTYQAGRDDPDDVPQTSRLAVRALFAHWHENREPVITGMTATQLPMHLQQLIFNATVPHFDPDN